MIKVTAIGMERRVTSPFAFLSLSRLSVFPKMDVLGMDLDVLKLFALKLLMMFSVIMLILVLLITIWTRAEKKIFVISLQVKTYVKIFGKAVVSGVD